MQISHWHRNKTLPMRPYLDVKTCRLDILKFQGLVTLLFLWAGAILVHSESEVRNFRRDHIWLKDGTIMLHTDTRFST